MGGDVFGNTAVDELSAQAADGKGDSDHIDVLYGTAVQPKRIRMAVIEWGRAFYILNATGLETAYDEYEYFSFEKIQVRASRLKDEKGRLHFVF